MLWRFHIFYSDAPSACPRLTWYGIPSYTHHHLRLYILIYVFYIMYVLYYWKDATTSNLFISSRWLFTRCFQISVHDDPVFPDNELQSPDVIIMVTLSYKTVCLFERTWPLHAIDQSAGDYVTSMGLPYFNIVTTWEQLDKNGGRITSAM